MKPWAEKFYKGKTWQQCRNAFFKIKFGICERCSGAGKIVHHKVKLTPYNINNPLISLSHDNLELLCQDCHNKEHQLKAACGEGLAFDDFGNLIKQDTPG